MKYKPNTFCSGQPCNTDLNCINWDKTIISLWFLLWSKAITRECTYGSIWMGQYGSAFDHFPGCKLVISTGITWWKLMSSSYYQFMPTPTTPIGINDSNQIYCWGQQARIPGFCQFWYTATLSWPVKTKKRVNSRNSCKNRPKFRVLCGGGD